MSVPTAGPEEQLNVGFEKDRLGGWPGELNVRWWVYLWVPGHKLRNSRARLGVEDNGFTFARGGRTHSEEHAGQLIREAQTEAEREMSYWRGQPSHALGPSGELVPLGAVAPEIGP